MLKLTKEPDIKSPSGYVALLVDSRTCPVARHEATKETRCTLHKFQDLPNSLTRRRRQFNQGFSLTKTARTVSDSTGTSIK